MNLLSLSKLKDEGGIKDERTRSMPPGGAE
jgi:hypothetical protein